MLFWLGWANFFLFLFLLVLVVVRNEGNNFGSYRRHAVRAAADADAYGGAVGGQRVQRGAVRHANTHKQGAVVKSNTHAPYCRALYIYPRILRFFHIYFSS